MDYFFQPENKHEYLKYVGADYDLDYYQWCWNEMKKLKDKSEWNSDQYLHLKNEIKKIKSILLYQLIKEIFGENDESNEDEKCYNLKDFRLLYHDGNERYASACNGDKYIGFVYGTS